MKSNELRLGNLVTIDNENHRAKLKNMPLKVTAINQLQDLEGSKNGLRLELLVLLPNTYYETYSQYLHFIKPIQINEAWLKSFGFEKPCNGSSKFSYEREESTFCIEYFEYTKAYHFTGGEGVRFGNGCKYVHQLQNLYYALMGEELSLSGI